jgi:integrase
MKAKRIRSRDMRGLFFRKGGWWIDVQINGKRFREFAGPTESQAKIYRNKLLAWKRDVKNGLPAVRPEGEPVKFEALADDFLELYAKQKRSYRRDKLSIDHLKAFFKGWLLKDIDAEAVARYRASRADSFVPMQKQGGKTEKRSISVGTINRELACLRTALRKAVEWGKLPAYPLPKEKLLSREPEFKPRILEPDEARRLVLASESKWLRPAVIAWLNTGLRKMELLKLRREHVDFKRRTLTVVSANAKNGRERTMPINELVVETLAAMPGEAFFFENPETRRNILDLLKPFKAAVKAAEIKGRVRIHDLRDTFATLALRGGVDIRTVAELIGDSPEVALKRYCHSDERTKREAVDRIAGLVIESRPKVHDGPVEDMQPATESVS